MRPRRDLAAMQDRRMRAADLFEQGVIPAAAHDGSVSRIRSSRTGAPRGVDTAGMAHVAPGVRGGCRG